MSADIEFGEVEQPRPKRGIRPDAHPHYAVAACGEVGPNDLPIFVDLDAMIDMEDHALSDDTVELGGVMLGGQYEDDQGRAFVVVTDCLRAKHYESTRGSFKFTHDTWSEITRQRDEYPEDTVMVGWYHTHPDWGVFLSGMDLFICNNFFNKPLDLALVIDPCRDDRGWFQWLPAGGQPQRTGGFYVMSSRFREQEVQFAAETWKEGEVMFSETRRRSAASTSVPAGGSTIVQLSDRENTWTPVILAASLILQTAVLAPLLWKMAQPTGEAEALAKEVKTLTDAVKQQHERLDLDSQRQRLAVEEQTVDAVIQSLKLGPEHLTKRLNEAQGERDDIKVDLSMQRRANVQIERELASTKRNRDELEGKVKSRDEYIAKKDEKHKTEVEGLKEKLKTTEEELKGFKGDPPEGIAGWLKLPAGSGLGIGGLLLGAMAGAAAVWVSRQPNNEAERSSDRESRTRSSENEVARNPAPSREHSESDDRPTG